MSAPAGDERRLGVGFGAAAYLLWGVFPLYWPLLEPANALEILAMRMLWSLVVVAVIVRVTGQGAAVRAVVSDRRRMRLLSVAAVLVTVNWGIYIWAVNAHHVIETSLGYFINPLVTIVLGVVVFSERLRPVQWVAVGVATLAIVVLSVDYGRLPWIALVLAASFGCYGLLKKQAQVGAVESLTIETSVMAVPAAVLVTVLAARSDLAFGQHGAGNAALLAASGAVTAVPLLLFAGAARRLPLSTLGLLQYLAPVLQFAVGVGIRHEPMNSAQLAGFCLVWLALLMLSADALRASRSSRAVRDGITEPV